MSKSRAVSLVLVLCVAACIGCSPSSIGGHANQASHDRTFKAQVVHVTDGDTIKVLCGIREIKVRLLGIDCPELKQPFGKAGKRSVSELTSSQAVIVRGSEHDRYGRLLAEVILLNGCNVNHMLVASGHAWWYHQYAAKDKVLEILQAEAKRAKKGLWSEKRPIPPWRFRRNIQK